MNKIKSIIHNELRLYSYSWLGWISFLILNIISGVGFLIGSVIYGNFENFFSLLEIPFALSIFVLGSRTLSKDKELGVLTFFFTAPIRLSDMVLGKFFALFLFFALEAFLLLFYPLMGSLFFAISWMSVISGYFALMLCLGLFSAISLFSSSFTENPLVSIVISFGIWIFLTLLGSIYGSMDPNFPMTYIVRGISYGYHFSNINMGSFSGSNILYFFVSIIFMLKLTESKILSQVAR